jgi:hypothetical protein
LSGWRSCDGSRAAERSFALLVAAIVDASREQGLADEFSRNRLCIESDADNWFPIKLSAFTARRNTQRNGCFPTNGYRFFDSFSDLKQAAPQCNGDGVCPVISPELIQQILDMKIDGVFGNRELVGNLFVAITVPDKPENVEFADRQIIVAQIFRETGSYLRWNVPPPLMNGPDNAEQFSRRHTFQDVGGCPGSHGAMDVRIAV